MGLADWLDLLLGRRRLAKPPPAVPPSTSAPPLAAPPPAPFQLNVPNVPPAAVPPAGARPTVTSTPAPAPSPAKGARPPAASTGGADLRLTRFAPLSPEELRARAMRHSLAGDPWLGRVDTIPPADDPRTALIDSALVANGYLTPEQLAQIHEVGDLYREHRPDFAMARTAATQAVVADQTERAKRKAEKQAAAAARREARKAAVAARKASDIGFLGRGVSTQLADRRAEVEKLQAAGQPLLATPGDVAAFLGLTIPRLRWLAFHSEASAVSHYVFFEVPKKTGGVRRLAAPHRDLAAAQRAILRGILARIPAHDAAHGFVPGRGTLSNARPHVGARVVVNLDLKDFFPSVGFPRLRGILAAVGFSPCAATILALLCSECPRSEANLDGQRLFIASGPRALPQGACTSPALANLACRVLDARLAGLARAWGWTYTRYADDLTFSTASHDEAAIGRLLTAVRNVVGDEGYTVNEDKTRVLRRSQAQEVTGLVVNQRPKAPRALIRRLRAILHRAGHEGLAAQDREGRGNFAAWLRGMIAYVAMTDATTAARFRAQLDRIEGRQE